MQNSRSQQLSFKCSLLRRSIERGRLFGAGRKAVEEAVFSAVSEWLNVSKTLLNLMTLWGFTMFYMVMSSIIMLYNTILMYLYIND